MPALVPCLPCSPPGQVPRVGVQGSLTSDIVCTQLAIWFLANLGSGLLIYRLRYSEQCRKAESGRTRILFLQRERISGWRLAGAGGESHRAPVLVDLALGSPTLTSLRAEASRVREASVPMEPRGLRPRLGFLLGEIGNQTNPVCRPWAPSTWEGRGGRRGELAGGWGCDGSSYPCPSP